MSLRGKLNSSLSHSHEESFYYLYLDLLWCYNLAYASQKHTATFVVAVSKYRSCLKFRQLAEKIKFKETKGLHTHTKAFNNPLSLNSDSAFFLYEANIQNMMKFNASV